MLGEWDYVTRRLAPCYHCRLSLNNLRTPKGEMACTLGLDTPLPHQKKQKQCHHTASKASPRCLWTLEMPPVPLCLHVHAKPRKMLNCLQSLLQKEQKLSKELLQTLWQSLNCGLFDDSGSLKENCHNCALLIALLAHSASGGALNKPFFAPCLTNSWDPCAAFHEISHLTCPLKTLTSPLPPHANMCYFEAWPDAAGCFPLWTNGLSLCLCDGVKFEENHKPALLHVIIFHLEDRGSCRAIKQAYIKIPKGTVLTQEHQHSITSLGRQHL